jgi:hypothetical protein
MHPIAPQDVRDYLERLALANEYEIQELRAATVELKLRQLWALMKSADLFEDEVARESGVRKIRERWARFHQALHAKSGS